MYLQIIASKKGKNPMKFSNARKDFCKSLNSFENGYLNNLNNKWFL